MSKTFYVTTPLYYVNGVPHVGHTYTTVIGDAIARYKRLCGVEVCALTGTDEHGLKIERTARESKVSPQVLTDKYSAAFQAAWSKLGLQYDEFIRTTETRHAAAVREMFHRIRRNRFIYLGEYSGNYCVSCEAYAGDDQKICVDCGRPTEFVTEQSYFFKLSAFQEKLLSFYQDNPDFVVPATRMNEIISFVKGGLKDLSISRTSFSWGIRVPEDEKHIFYVWFDALTGYLSGIGYPADADRVQRLWPADVQLIAKDILRFHAVYWPAFLMASGLEPPRHILTHGWWTIGGEKMSKSRGNFVTADELADLLPADYVKYFLLREIPLGSDGDFSYEALVNRVNSDLANDIGNLASRTLKMIENYFEGKVPECAELEGRDEELRRFSIETLHLYREYFDKLQIAKALDAVRELISVVNKYIVTNEPWVLAKDFAKRRRLGAVLYNSAEALRIIAVMLGPAVPEGAAKILRQLGVAQPLMSQRIQSMGWGELRPGSAVGPVEAVFPRLDLKEFLARVEARRAEEARRDAAERCDLPQPGVGELIGIEDFAKIDMRVGKILAAERVEGSDKLVKLQVDIGSGVRQVVAGIGRAYSPESLPGRLIVVVANLKPAKLMGLTSDGMIVAASEGGNPVLVTFTEPVVVGSRLK